MTITELIAALEAVRAEHGDDVQMAIYSEGDHWQLEKRNLAPVRSMQAHTLVPRAFAFAGAMFTTGPTVRVLSLIDP